MRAIVTVGLGFGDEGKGAAIDSLTRTLSADLVVRYSGGPQAGHNVQLSDGRRHTFSQFGAGTLAGARTWLGPRMIISPESMQPEADHLRELGVDDPFARLAVHPDCLVATGYHVCMNRLREKSRGDGRHGSCGQGVGETRHYWLKHGLDAIVARDLLDRNTLTAKLALLRDRCLLEMQSLPSIDDELGAKLHAATPAQIADDLLWASEELHRLDRIPRCETVLFEGSQGVLLDEWNGFHPYTTWSTVTPLHAQEILSQHGISDATVLGLTRAITTRHGAGPFPTYCPHLTASVTDPGNPTNPWQGSIRSGPLDLVLLRYAAAVSGIDGLVVSWLDQLPRNARVCTRYEGITDIERPRTLAAQSALTEYLETVAPVYSETDRDNLLENLSSLAPVVGTADGPEHQDREWDRSGIIRPATEDAVSMAGNSATSTEPAASVSPELARVFRNSGISTARTTSQLQLPVWESPAAQQAVGFQCPLVLRRLEMRLFLGSLTVLAVAIVIGCSKPAPTPAPAPVTPMAPVPDEPEDPGAPTEPEDPANPDAPEDPVAPDEPATPDEPVDPPVAPDTPADPPVTPDTPDEPKPEGDAPAAPDKPEGDTPEKPEVKPEGDAPEKPEATPDTPEKPEAEAEVKKTDAPAETKDTESAE